MNEQQAVLAVDVGGSHVKLLASGEAEPRRVPSGPSLDPAAMTAAVIEAAQGWRYDVVSVGVPAPVHGGRLLSEPFNLGRGWVGFDFEAAFGVPTRVINDAAMQALGSYEGGAMLFLGLGTGLGSSLIVDGRLEPMEIAHLPFKRRTFEDYLGERGRERYGRKRWEELVAQAVEVLGAALQPDEVVLGGGNAARLRRLPPGTRRGSNEHAFTGGFRLWQREGAPATTPPRAPAPEEAAAAEPEAAGEAEPEAATSPAPEQPDAPAPDGGGASAPEA